MQKGKTLTEEIKQFQNEKKWYITVLLALGTLGLILPVLPGLFLIGLAVSLISPKYGDLFNKKIKEWIKSLVRLV